MPIQSMPLFYQAGATRMQGHVALDSELAGSAPVIIIAPTWTGCGDFARNRAQAIAEQGYIGFAIDLYGDGVEGNDPDSCQVLMQPLINDRALLLQRMEAAMLAAAGIAGADPQKIAAIGYCFGGLCVLDLARSGADISGVVSFHGLLHRPETLAPQQISSKVLVLHGYDDPMVPPEQMLGFQQEMSETGADWQLHSYGNTVHGFTNPAANSPGQVCYNEVADKRSWASCQVFLQELFES